MSPISKCRSQPDRPDAFTLTMDQLESLLDSEHSYTPQLHISMSLDGNSQGEITAAGRNGSVNVLRCLKMWYDLPSDVFMVAVNVLDRFLAKMKVRTKHIACISVSSLYIASELLGENVDADDLVSISQSKCTSMDMRRMAAIIQDKLALDKTTVPVTALGLLRQFHGLLGAAADRLNIAHTYERIVNEQEMCMLLEIVACDVRCSSDLPSVVALVLLFVHLEQYITTEQNLNGYLPIEILKLYTFAVELKTFCKIDDDEFSECFGRIISILNLYNGQLRLPYRQRLVWKVSNRTMRKLRPTRQLAYVLPTIVEDNSYACNVTLH